MAAVVTSLSVIIFKRLTKKKKKKNEGYFFSIFYGKQNGLKRSGFFSIFSGKKCGLKQNKSGLNLFCTMNDLKWNGLRKELLHNGQRKS